MPSLRLLGLVLILARGSDALKVAIAGAAGRTGRLVVAEALQRQYEVVALVRSPRAARKVLPTDDENLTVQKVDLGAASTDELREAVSGADAAIWCASGFSDASNPLNRLRGLFTVKFRPEEYIEVAGLTRFGEAMATAPGVAEGGPQLVMCSAAAVTRPSWDDAKKEALAGCADIPIVRLNPLGILDVKAQGERELRGSGCRYTIIRPTGLNDKWPAGRPVLTQGDVAVGRICRADVAHLLTAMLTEAGAVGKTVEATALSGYPKPRSYGTALDRCVADADADGPQLDEEIVAARYALMQQLLPGEPRSHHERDFTSHCIIGAPATTTDPIRAGELQDAAALAMGQTYEELDEGKEGRLGKRGQETAPIINA